MTTIATLAADGSPGRRELLVPKAFHRPTGPLLSRSVYAAAHVVPRVAGENVPGAAADIDWDATLGFRRHLWSWGLGVADAMDTAQRGMGMDPTAVRELVRRSSAEAAACGGALLVGVSTDHVEDEVISLEAVITAYLEQIEHARAHGAGVVLMASRHLAAAAGSAADYERVYHAVLTRAGGPVVLHWLGEVFDPRLSGYFGPELDVPGRIEVVARIVGAHAGAVHGVKMSLLRAEHEIALRRLLPAGTRMFTGDDYHYTELIEGDGQHHSDALLGAFAALAPQVCAAVTALDAGDGAGFHAILHPTERLARQVFAPPTFHYKAGVAFLAWLNGHQPGFTMVGGLHSARSLPHLSRLVELADEVGALEDPELAAWRWNRLLGLHGVPVPAQVSA